MSVTFYIEAPEDAAVQISCACEHSFPEVFTSRKVAYDAAMVLRAQGVHPEACTDEYCRADAFLYVTEVEQTVERNVSNANARFVLDALGYVIDEDGIYGSASGEEFLGRVLMAEALSPVDAGVPAHQVFGFGGEQQSGATLIDCGRHEGYLQDVLNVLREVAEVARSTGRTVRWN